MLDIDFSDLVEVVRHCHHQGLPFVVGLQSEEKHEHADVYKQRHLKHRVESQELHVAEECVNIPRVGTVQTQVLVVNM